MELPITIVVEPPSLVALRALLRRRWMWVVAAVILAVAGGALVLVVTVSRAEALAAGTSLDLNVVSRPSGADVAVDGRAAGRTPLNVSVSAGAHSVSLKMADAVDAGYAVDVHATGAALDALLWRHQPLLGRLRSSLPGAQLVSARLRPDGEVALALKAGAEDDLQAWRFHPLTGEQAPIGGTSLAAAGLAVSPSGQLLATIGREIGPLLSSNPQQQRVVWLSDTSEADRSATALWHASVDDRVVDVVWMPDERGLLAVTEAVSPRERGVRTRVWLIDLASGGTQLLASLPSHIVAGAFAWRPDSGAVAFVAHAGSLNALCLLDLDGDFHYLADLEPSTTPPLPYPPVAWSSDSRRLAFAAPRQELIGQPASWLQTRQQRVLYVADTASADVPRVLAEVDAQAVAWREDGKLVTLERGRNGQLDIGLVEATGHPERLLELPTQQAVAYAAEWDLGRARLLIASLSGGAVEYWLARLALEEQP